MCAGLGTKHGRREVNKEKWQMKMASNCRYHHQLTAYCRRVAPCIPLLSPLFRSQPQPACLSIIQSVIHFSPGRAGPGWARMPQVLTYQPRQMATSSFTLARSLLRSVSLSCSLSFAFIHVGIFGALYGMSVCVWVCVTSSLRIDERKQNKP